MKNMMRLQWKIFQVLMKKLYWARTMRELVARGPCVVHPGCSLELGLEGAECEETCPLRRALL